MTTESVGNEFDVVQKIMVKFVKDQKHFGFITKDMSEQESKFLGQGKEVKDTIFKDEREVGKLVAGLDDIQLKLLETLENMEFAKERLELAELDQGQSHRKVQLVEEESARVNARLTEIIQKLGSSESKIMDNENMMKIAELRQITAEEKIELMTVHSIEAGFIANECQRKCDEVESRLKIVNGELERFIARADYKLKKIEPLQLEIEEKMVRTKELQAKSNSELSADDMMDNKVVSIKEKVKETEMKCEFLDKTIEKMDMHIDDLYDQLLKEKLAFLEVSKNLDANLQDAMEVVDEEAEEGVDLTGGFASYMDGGAIKVSQSNNEN